MCCWTLFLFNLIVVVCRKADTDLISETGGKNETALKASSPRTPTSTEKPQIWAILEGLQLILSSTYLLQVALFLWLSAVVSSFFYFQVRKPFVIWDFNYLLYRWSKRTSLIANPMSLNESSLYLVLLSAFNGFWCMTLNKPLKLDKWHHFDLDVDVLVREITVLYTILVNPSPIILVTETLNKHW